MRKLTPPIMVSTSPLAAIDVRIAEVEAALSRAAKEFSTCHVSSARFWPAQREITELQERRARLGQKRAAMADHIDDDLIAPPPPRAEKLSRGPAQKYVTHASLLRTLEAVAGATAKHVRAELDGVMRDGGVWDEEKSYRRGIAVSRRELVDCLARHAARRKAWRGFRGLEAWREKGTRRTMTDQCIEFRDDLTADNFFSLPDDEQDQVGNLVQQVSLTLDTWSVRERGRRATLNEHRELAARVVAFWAEEYSRISRRLH